MSNSTAADLFNENFEIPSFDAGTTVPAQTMEKNTDSNEGSQLPLYIGIGLAILIVVVLLSMILKKQKNKVEEEEVQVKEQQKEEEHKPQAIEIKASKKTNNFATPTNINKCIRLFLENTRTK